MRSFAVWYEPSSLQENIEEQGARDFLNINFWSQVSDNQDFCYFDFGIYIHNIDLLKTIYFYCPFKVEKEDISDLGEKLDDSGLVNAIFNELHIVSKGNAKRKLIERRKDKDKFIIYEIQEDNDIKIRYCKRELPINKKSNNKDNKGTIIAINVFDLRKYAEADVKAYNSYYFRFRIRANKESLSLICHKVNSETLFTDSFVSTEIMDFRINDIRSCCEEVREQFNCNKHFNFKSIHYLVMRNAVDRVIVEGCKCISRLLENDLWKSYISGLDENVIAYHFKIKSKDKEAVDSLSVLVRFQERRSNWKVYLKYIIIVISLSFIYDFLKFIVKVFLNID